MIICANISNFSSKRRQPGRQIVYFFCPISLSPEPNTIEGNQRYRTEKVVEQDNRKGLALVLSDKDGTEKLNFFESLIMYSWVLLREIGCSRVFRNRVFAIETEVFLIIFTSSIVHGQNTQMHIAYVVCLDACFRHVLL